MRMKAIIRAQYGGAEVIQVATLERPVPRKNEVLIRVKAAGLDYGQWHLMAGKPYAMRLATGLTKPKQCVLGMDVSGVVEAVGPEVTRFKAGDAVFGASSGTFAEFTCAREDQICLKPERLTFEEAAASAISGVTALIGLRDVGKVKPGESVCVIGAGGGVGSWAVQLARHFGAHVTAVWIFVGAQQHKVKYDLVELLQEKGEDARCVKVTATARNALDFHMAYYAGKLLTEDPESYVHLIAKDTGMDPLISHLQSQGLKAYRWASVLDIPIVKKSAVTSEDEKLSHIIEYLVRRGDQRPTSIKTLMGSVAALFSPKLDDSETSALVEKLKANGLFEMVGNRVQYGLPD